MARQNVTLLAFNRGEVGRRALARIDMDRMRLSAETQLNWMPRTIGSMAIRPGTEYKLSTLSDAKAKVIPFFRSTTIKAALEITDSYIRPLIDDAVITRASVATTVTNGDFSSGTGWTITTTGGSSGAVSGGKLTMTCLPIDSYVVTSRTVTVAGGDQNVEHAFRIVVDQGPVVLRVGSSSGGDEYISQTTLGTGTHSLAFTPTGANVYVELEGRVAWSVIVDSITVEGAGTMTLPATYLEADLGLIRWAQSGDVVFIDAYGYKPRKIERRGTRSWSNVLYEPIDGPFFGTSGDPDIKMSINAVRSSGTLTATRPYFKSTHVGALFRMFTPGYNLPFSLGKDDCFTPAVRINGVGTGRNVDIVTTGTWAGTLTVQKSYVGEDSGFVDTATTITTNTTTTVTDTSDNTAIWVRVGFKTGGYTSGLAVATVSFGAGGGSASSGNTPTSVGGRTGVARITAVTNSTTATVDILSHFSSNNVSLDWFEGEWSDYRGFPSSVTFHEGRLWHAGQDKIWGSVSDSYYSFDPGVSGDSGPIQRSIGYGPLQVFNGLVSLNRLVGFTQASEVQVKSSSFDEPLTPTNFSIKDVSTYGSSSVGQVKVDTRSFYTNRPSHRLMEISYSVELQDYRSRDLGLIHPDLNLDNEIIHVAVQRLPDTRIHCVREDGTVAILIYEPENEVMAWVRYETDGIVEDVYVLPGHDEDDVYYIVKRTINGNTKRYHEKWAVEADCQGETISKIADCFYEYSGASTATISGLSHLEGESVVVWGAGKALGTYTVASGSITLSEAVTGCIVGLPYTATFKSSKLAYAAQMGTALVQKKRVHSLGLLLYNTHYQGLQYGGDFTNMYNLPLMEGGAATAADTIYADYDEASLEFGGEWDTDSRLCLKATAPYPVTVLACVLGMETNDK